MGTRRMKNWIKAISVVVLIALGAAILSVKTTFAIVAILLLVTAIKLLFDALDAFDED
jgi:hypothetical protein